MKGNYEIKKWGHKIELKKMIYYLYPQIGSIYKKQRVNVYNTI